MGYIGGKLPALSLIHIYKKMRILLEGAYQKEKGEWPALRNLHEAVFPEAARKMCRVKDWTYKSLYIHVIEHAANQLKIPEFSIYTGEQIEALIKKRLEALRAKGKPLEKYLALFDSPKES